MKNLSEVISSKKDREIIQKEFRFFTKELHSLVIRYSRTLNYKINKEDITEEQWKAVLMQLIFQQGLNFLIDVSENPDNFYEILDKEVKEALSIRKYGSY